MTIAEKKELLKEFEKFLDTKPTTVEIKSEYKVGEVIEFSLTTGEKVSAMAMRQDEDGMLFVFVDCLKTRRPMFENANKGCYLDSDLRHALNNKILDTFPDSIKSRMKEMQNGDKLRLLTEKEVFGKNRFGEVDNGTWLTPMGEIRNRIAFLGNGSDHWSWWCLQNNIDRTISVFSAVNENGYQGEVSADDVVGVRPAFKL